MINLNDTLPELMRRATENLEPESTDLVERGMARGAVLRRRRTALISLSSATAVLATAGIIAAGTQIFDGASAKQAPAASTADTTTTTTTTTTAPPTATRQVSKSASPATTLATLRKVVPANLQQSAPKIGTVNGVFKASVVVDDGKGASLVEVLMMNAKPNLVSCAGIHGTCTVSKDGTMTSHYTNELIFPYELDKNPAGVRVTVVDIVRADGTTIAIYSYNARNDLAGPKTRATPLFSAADLAKLANDQQWVYPPAAGNGQPAGPGPGTGKPTVPVAQTLQTLKSVLTKPLQFTRSETWGGGANGFNGAAYVVDDGKGLSRIDVLVTYERPVTKCGEGLPHCRVREDGSLTTWSKDEPVYSDARQAAQGVLSSRVEVHYRDGRMIAMTSYNAPQEKDTKHTRAKPAFSTEELLSMATDADWEFPGTGDK
ncbi:hypothetical protein [Streptomyces sp. SID13031]|uniref:hypothetical protein n=1 Tax=Streptomyces sp. SID13031 TaxID=2706046 RepID=UPI0013CB1494|nr:hypothetical protein [Streptomyces sp. SID13031]NEA31047.1 hypothetical protein [Streptomyces sp. SID13031]